MLALGTPTGSWKNQRGTLVEMQTNRTELHREMQLLVASQNVGMIELSSDITDYCSRPPHS